MAQAAVVQRRAGGGIRMLAAEEARLVREPLWHPDRSWCRIPFRSLTLSQIALKANDAMLGASALQAFRADQPLGGASPDAEDEAATLTATLLRQQLSVPLE